jgi:hypothetical protein
VRPADPLVVHLRQTEDGLAQELFRLVLLAVPVPVRLGRRQAQIAGQVDDDAEGCPSLPRRVPGRWPRGSASR